MKSFIKIAQYVDYLVAGCSLGWAAYTQSWLWAVGGLLGLVIAWYGPADKIDKIASKFFVKKKQKVVPNDVATLGELHQALLPTTAPDAPVPVTLPTPLRNPPLAMYFVQPFPGCKDFSNRIHSFNK